ncbi:MAG: hypothetical protein IJZ62_04800 [Clostridia bacterium]|nr:hypothetical protein [Clostridia bacterium]
MFDDLFLAYAKHEQEKEDVIQMILDQVHAGHEVDFINLTIQLDDHFSDEDIDYIKEEVYRRMR